MRNKRVLKVGIIVVILLIVFSGIYAISKGIIGRSYSSRAYVENKSMEGDKDENVVEVPSKEFEEEGNSVSKTKSIYDSNGLAQRMEGYLGNRYDNYRKVIADIGDMSKGIFSQITLDTSSSVEQRFSLHGVGNLHDLEFSELRELDDMSFSGDALTIIAFYNDTYVLCAYNYPYNASKSLLCIDFSEHQFVVESENLMYDIGDNLSVSISPKQGIVKVVDGWNVLFVKG